MLEPLIALWKQLFNQRWELREGLNILHASRVGELSVFFDSSGTEGNLAFQMSRHDDDTLRFVSLSRVYNIATRGDVWC